MFPAFAFVMVVVSAWLGQRSVKLRVDECIKYEIETYGDAIGEDPDQSPRNIVKQTGQAIKECLK